MQDAVAAVLQRDWKILDDHGSHWTYYCSSNASCCLLHCIGVDSGSHDMLDRAFQVVLDSQNLAAEVGLDVGTIAAHTALDSAGY